MGLLKFMMELDIIYDGTRYLVLFGAEKKYFGAEIPQLDQKI